MLALLALVFSALPGFAQTTWSASLTATHPTFVALDTVGGTKYLYVSEHGSVPSGGAMTSDGGRILKFNLTSGSTTPTVIANHGTGDGQFISPDAIAIDPATHNLFIADRYLNRVQEITNTGTFVMKFGSGTVGAADEMQGPVGLAFDNAGALYVSEHGATDGSPIEATKTVSKYTISGSTATRVWRKNIGSQPAYAVSALDNHIFISAGSALNKIVIWDLNGNAAGSITTPGISLGSSFDASGNLWAGIGTANEASAPQEIVQFNINSGAALGSFGTPGSGNGQFKLPFDVVVDSAANKAYVADYDNNRVQVLSIGSTTPTGSVPTINSSASATGTVGANFSYNVTATNGPITGYTAVDALPAGLVLNTNTGAITGIPTTAGTTTTHLTATNSAGTSAQFALTITVNAATSGGGGSTPGTPAAPLGPKVTSLAVSAVTKGVGGDFKITFDSAVTGVDASDFTMNSQGSANGAITGVDAVAGDPKSFLIHFTYSDVTGWLQLGIKTTGTGITNSAGDAFRGAGVTASPIYGTGGNGASTLQAPTATVTAGTATGNNVSYTVVYSAPVTGVDASDFIITGTDGTIGTVSGSGATYTVPVTASGSGTVTLTAIGGASANVKNSANNWFAGGGTTSASATIAASTGGGGSAPVVSSATTASATVGTAFTYQITASNSPTSYAASNLSGTGLSVDASTGVISGTPTAAGTITSSVTATNATGTSAPVTLTITVAPASTGSAPVISSATSATATVGAAFNYQIAASNAPTSFAATGLAGTGLSVDASTGVISGTPTTAGTITTDLTATNATGTSAAVTLTITVNAAGNGGGSGSAPVISSSTSASATVGSAFNYQIAASNSPTSYAATGLSGSGLSLDASTGVISGTPTTSGTLTVQLTATNAAGTSAAVTLTITVNPADNGGGNGGGGNPPPPPLQDQTITFVSPTSDLFVGDSLKLTASASSGLPVAYTVVSGDATIVDDTLMANGAGTVVVRAAQSGDSQYNSASTNATFTVIKHEQSVDVSSIPQATHTDSGLSLAATTDSGLPISYTVVSGPATVDGNMLTFTGTGTVVVRAMQGGNAMYDSASQDITITANPIPRLTNISSRVHVSANDSAGATIVGFVVTGDAPKQMLIRAVGPTLSGYGIANPLSDPTLKLFDVNGNVIATNDGWADDAQISAAGDTLKAFPLTAGSKDAALLVTLAPGTYTAQVQSAANSGTVLVEVYDVSATAPVPTKQLVNISTRGAVGTGQDGIVAGFYVSGNEPKKVLIRAVGPELANYHVTGVLNDPMLTVYDAQGNVVTQNDNWGTAEEGGTVTPASADDISAAATASGAFPLTAGGADAAVVVTLQPGSYTAVVHGANGTTGAALVEVYEVPNP